jgi:SAM-dependent methyltransferase
MLPTAPATVCKKKSSCADLGSNEAVKPARFPRLSQIARGRCASQMAPRAASVITESAPMSVYSYTGYCPCCEQGTTFSSNAVWLRDHYICLTCLSVVRERALMLLLKEIMPDWRERAIHESSPADHRGASKRLREQCRDYTATHYFPTVPLGHIHQGFRNEDLERQTFETESLDLVVTIDVMEHVFNPADAYREVYRTLKPGGYYLHTFPIRKWQSEPLIRRAELLADGNIRHLVGDPEYHNNPLDESGCLVTFDYGYDITQQIRGWAPFTVRIVRFCDEYHGIIGEYTDVTVCKKERTQ